MFQPNVSVVYRLMSGIRNTIVTSAMKVNVTYNNRQLRMFGESVFTLARDEANLTAPAKRASHVISGIVRLRLWSSVESTYFGMFTVKIPVLLSASIAMMLRSTASAKACITAVAIRPNPARNI